MACWLARHTHTTVSVWHQDAGHILADKYLRSSVAPPNGANGADLVEMGTRDHAFKGSPTSKVNVSADNPKKSIACGLTARCGEHFSSFV